MSRPTSRGQAAAQRARYQRCREAGACVTCGTREGLAGAARCAACRQLGCQATARYRARLRTAGLCLQCRQRPTGGTHVRCFACRVRLARPPATSHTREEGQ